MEIAKKQSSKTIQQNQPLYIYSVYIYIADHITVGSGGEIAPTYEAIEVIYCIYYSYGRLFTF